MHRTIAIAACLLLSTLAHAGTSCKPVPNPYYPGLQRCSVTVDVDEIEANPPVPQKMPLWCWAASLAMIYTAEGHPISQESIVIQNFGKLEDAPGGSFTQFEARLNRKYKDDNGQIFTSVATRILTPAGAKDALENDLPILYTTSHHATVQLDLTYEVAPGGPVVFRGGAIWDPAPGVGTRKLSQYDVTSFVAAWSINVQ